MRQLIPLLLMFLSSALFFGGWASGGRIARFVAFAAALPVVALFGYAVFELFTLLRELKTELVVALIGLIGTIVSPILAAWLAPKFIAREAERSEAKKLEKSLDKSFSDHARNPVAREPYASRANQPRLPLEKRESVSPAVPPRPRAHVHEPRSPRWEAAPRLRPQYDDPLTELAGLIGQEDPFTEFSKLQPRSARGPDRRASPEPRAPSRSVAQSVPRTSKQVVRTGIIAGMAYTLYSDRSIEVELSAGKVSFDSIEELQKHVRRSEAVA